MSQLPNAMVYQSAIRNFTVNPKRREDFVVGIGYDDRIDEAQEVARRVLEEHTAVLKDPEPWVLVDDLGKATVNLRVYFWLDGHDHSWLKVRSSVIRLIKRAFQEHGISMPDAAREVIFPRGVPVVMMPESSSAEALADAASASSKQACGVGTIATPAEGGLSSEADALKEQARQSHPVDESENLLRGDARSVGGSGESEK
jgi:small-conductance mechanosensitive channel